MDKLVTSSKVYKDIQEPKRYGCQLDSKGCLTQIVSSLSALECQTLDGLQIQLVQRIPIIGKIKAFLTIKEVGLFSFLFTPNLYY